MSIVRMNGVKVQEAAKDARDEVGGCTFHYVEEGLMKESFSNNGH